ncbi:MAG: ribulose bisphosphate carboxylase small subunit [Limnochordaceae bacterium]|uniref:Ribulose bisphosphate carboxylase small subunit n=1 Tax=Carboxydichorda subterranea TaxID=3109565 RepID=A0ABZ1BYQ0_9FIRM|nr:ribulose bisphosphate carboxylase small subunit [Limnochorda sp. L945t]MBE3598771.1 ribulose bisphosphate carboxylase small subunit [Limnochordaceae bacterium]WRP17965.1 ribulose bisphosphate carboxylase small subunit [Limnochorda sp. L945t]
MALRTEMFSYLPPMPPEEVRQQVEYLIRRGYVPGIEFTQRLDSHDDFWSFWKLPFFRGATVDGVLAELEACKTAHPGATIRLTGYDARRQCQVLSFVVHRPA